MRRWIVIGVLSLLVLVLGITLGATSATLDDTRDELRNEYAKVLDAYAQLSVTLDSTELELAQTETELANTQSQLSDAEAELDLTRNALQAEVAAVDAAEAELAQTETELVNTQSQLSDTEAELADLQESFNNLEAVKGITFNGKLEVFDIDTYYTTVSGKVKNIGDEPLEKVVILVAFYAEDGALTHYGSNTVEALFVGETGEWSVYGWSGWTTFDIYAFTSQAQ